MRMCRVPTGISITYRLPLAHILWVRGLTTFWPDELQAKRSSVLNNRRIPFFIVLKPNSKNSFLFQFGQSKLVFGLC